MASIEKRGNRYNVRYRDPEGHNRRESFRTLAEARAFKIDTERSILVGEYIDTKARKTTIREFGEEWFQAQVWGDKATKDNRGILTNWVYPHFGAMYVAKVSAFDVKQWIKKMSLTLAPGTVALYHKLFAGMLRDARLAGLLTGSLPTDDSKLPEDRKPRKRALTQAQVAELAGLMPERFRAMVYVGAMAGLRIGETCALTERQLDMTFSKTLIIDQQWHGHGFHEPKTESSDRQVPLSAELADILSDHMRRFPPAGVDRVLFYREGEDTAVTPRALRDIWNELARPYVDVPADQETFHALRHHFGSVLLDKGVPMPVVAEYMGHTNARLIADTYGHAYKGRAELVHEALAAAWAPESTEAVAQ